MKNLLLLLTTFILLNSKINAQIEHLEILIPKEENYVSKYIDSLFSLKSNRNYKIEKDVTKKGELIYKVSFSLLDEDFYKCRSIFFVFERTNGVEYCFRQFIFGSSEFAQYHLNYIKDNFKSLSNGLWETSISNDDSIKLSAKFERTEDNLFNVTYEVKFND